MIHVWYPDPCSALYPNTSAKKQAYTQSFTARKKHFGLRMQLVSESIAYGEIWLEHMSTEIMPADILSKALGKEKHHNCVINLRMPSD